MDDLEIGSASVPNSAGRVRAVESWERFDGESGITPREKREDDPLHRGVKPLPQFSSHSAPLHRRVTAARNHSTAYVLNWPPGP